MKGAYVLPFSPLTPVNQPGSFGFDTVLLACLACEDVSLSCVLCELSLFLFQGACVSVAFFFKRFPNLRGRGLWE